MKATTLFAEWKDSYPLSESGETMNIYKISGSPEDIKAYEEYKGTFIRHCDQTGLPLYYTKYFKGNGPVCISDKGSYYIDDSAQQKIINKYRSMGLDPEKMLAQSFNEELKRASRPQHQAPQDTSEEEEVPWKEDDADLGDM
jgi:hypothetical protein